MNHDVLKTLVLPLHENLVPAPQAGQRVLFVNVTTDILSLFDCAAMPEIYQPFFPHARPWQDKGFNILPAIPEQEDSFDYVFILGSKNHKETNGFRAQALKILKRGGWLLAAAHNDSGGGRLVRDCKALSFTAQNMPKHHARVIFGQKSGMENGDLCQKWQTIAAAQPVLGGRLVSMPGLFCWDHVDAGSALLAKALPGALEGYVADFGCGYGFLSEQVLQRSGVKELTSIDADARAIACCRAGLEFKNESVAKNFIWTDLSMENHDLGPFDCVVMNPPFHEGKTEDVGIGRGFIVNAAQALKPGGVLYVVANAHLPYEKELSMHFSAVRKLAEEKGYKIYEAEK